MLETSATEAESNLWAAAGALRESRNRLGAIRPGARSGAVQPSLAQERLWRFSRAAQDSPYFNAGLVWDVQGPVDAAALEGALNDLIGRHEVFRSVFEQVNGQLRVFLSNRRVSLVQRGIGQGSLEGGRQAALEEARLELKSTFDLEHELPLSAFLFGYGEGASLFLLKIHQIVLDAGSITVLVRDLKVFYEARLRGSAAGLPQLPIQYYDFAAWQRGLLAGGKLADQQEFWRGVFARPYSPLPLGQASAAYRALPGPAGLERLQIPKSVCSQLTVMASQMQTSLFNVLLAGFHGYLQGVTGRSDTIVFATVAGRHQPELRNTVGLVANVLPFRTGVCTASTFRELLQAITPVIAGGQANQLLPLDRILEQIQIGGPRQAGGLFQASLAYQNNGSHGFSAGNTNFVVLREVDNGFSRFAIQLDLRLSEGGLSGFIKYRSDLFDGGFGGRFAADFSGLLQRWAADPGATLPRALDANGAVAAGFEGAAVQAAKSLGQSAQGGAASPVAAARGGLGNPSGQATGKGAGKGAGDSSPRDFLEQALVRIWEKVLKVAEVGVGDNFFNLGGDSLLAVQLMLEIEKQTGKNLPLVTLFEAPTVGALARIMRDEGWRPRWSCLVPIKADGAKPPFYCVHGVGGNILEFEHFSRYIDPEQPLYGIQAKGLDGKSPRHRTVEEMARHYLEEIRSFQPEGPYYLGGSSFGGVVAYEMARQLREEDLEVGLVVMFDTWAPGYLKFLPTTTAWQKRVSRWRFRFGLHWGDFWVTERGERMAYLRFKARRVGNRLRKNAKRFFRELAGRFQRLFHPKAIKEVQKAGVNASSSYVPKPFAGRVTLLRASEQPRGVVEDRTNGWSTHALDGVEVFEVPGHHGSIMRDPRARVLVATLTGCLDRAYQARAVNQGAAQAAPPGGAVNARQEACPQNGAPLPPPLQSSPANLQQTNTEKL